MEQRPDLCEPNLFQQILVLLGSRLLLIDVMTLDKECSNFPLFLNPNSLFSFFYEYLLTYYLCCPAKNW